MSAHAFCPSCSACRPSGDFLAVREPGDLYGASLRCRPCLVADAEAANFLTANRRAAKADPTSALARQWREIQQARARGTRAASIYARRLTPTSPALVAA